ncbi:MAG: Fic family protein [Candidatus Sphingomonas phytovorans]|nr:Fic family protein [Sphingomonas sp.]WEK00205.1 MAG: Fic family protein [Sphingomonas sp.]
MAAKFQIDHNKLIRINTLNLPNFSDLPESAKFDYRYIDNAFEKCGNDDAILRQLRSVASLQNDQVPPEMQPLRHRLSNHFLRLNEHHSYEQNRSALEERACLALEAYRTPTSGILRQPATLASVSIDDTPLTWRTTDIFIGGDAGGYRAKYPPHEQIQDSIERLSVALDDAILYSPSFGAALAFCGVVTAHPFRDGNGRVARVLFNHVLRTHFGSQFYLPIYELGAASAGGWLVAQRRVQLDGDWSALSEFLRNCVILFAR